MAENQNLNLATLEVDDARLLPSMRRRTRLNTRRCWICNTLRAAYGTCTRCTTESRDAA